MSEGRVDQIGARVTSAREAAGLTQAQLAERIPCNAQTISNWETGRRQPRYGDLLRLAEILGRPISWFLGEEPSAGGWEQVHALLDRVRGDLATVTDLVAARSPEAASQPPEQLVPITAVVEPGPVSLVRRQPGGWRALAVGQASGVALYRYTGDAHHPYLQDGDLLAIQPVDKAEVGEFVTARLADDREVLKRLGQGGELVSVNPMYAPIDGARTVVTGRLAWVLRELQPGEDPAQQAAAKLAWLEQAEGRLSALEARLETGDGQWSEAIALGEEIARTGELLRPVHGAVAVRHAANALARIARGLGEVGRYPGAMEFALRAAELYDAIERLGDRSREALNNLYAVSQLALFTGDLDLAERAARQAAESGDWTVRWKALKNLAEIAVNYRGERVDDRCCADILTLAATHRAEDPTQASLAEAVAHEILGNAAFAAGDLSAARAAAARELAAAEQAGLPYRIANALCNLAQYAVADGDGGAALAACARAASLTAAQDLGDLEAMRTAHRAAAEALAGDRTEARVWLARSLRQAARLGSERAMLMAELSGLVVARANDDTLALNDHLAAAREAARVLKLRAYEAVIDRLAVEESGS